MTALSHDRFLSALDRFKAGIAPNLAAEFSICSIQDVRSSIRDIQRKQGSEGKLRYMRRLEAFVEAMQQFSKVLDLFVNVNDLFCFIWGPIKFIILVAHTYLSSFDRILDTYAQIGEAVPGLLCYKDSFERHPILGTVLEDYYSDILSFHQAALCVFSRPKWKTLFHSTWKTFDSKFGPILTSLQRRGKLLESEKASASLYGIQKLQEGIQELREEQRLRNSRDDEVRRKASLSGIREKLLAPDYQIDQEMSSEDRNGSATGMWIVNDHRYRKWVDESLAGHAVLFVNGKPGSGKTTLMSSVIESLLRNRPSGPLGHSVLYFYFKHSDSAKRTYDSCLRAILEQLMDKDPAVFDHVFGQLSSEDGVNLRSTKSLETYVKAAVECYRLSYIVLDGLDECAVGDSTKVIEYFVGLTEGGLSEPDISLRVIFCGQRDGILDKLLSRHPWISLEGSGHIKDIEKYCQSFGEKIETKFGLSASMVDDIVNQVTSTAQDMFLYARVVLVNLLNQTSVSRLKQELKKDTFPQGIEKAYERVAVRLFDQASPAECEDASKILGWILCAPRLLRWREIQAYFCIDPVAGDVEYEERRLRISCKELCGSLVDIHHLDANPNEPESCVKIVHETACEFLFRRKLFDLSLENSKLAIYSLQYLTSAAFKIGITEAAVAQYANKGYYSLLSYAAQHWYDHLHNCITPTSTLDPDHFQKLIDETKAFFDAYIIASNFRKHQSLTSGEISNIVKGLPDKSRERNGLFSIGFRIIPIQRVVERLQKENTDPIVHETLGNLQGLQRIYKCPKPWCDFFSEGFDKSKDREEHTDRHDLPFRCPESDCFGNKLGFHSKERLESHRRSLHKKVEDIIEFPKFSSVGPKNNSVFQKACADDDVDAVEAMIKRGWHLNRVLNTAKSWIFYAAKHGAFKICRLLLERGHSVNGDRSLTDDSKKISRRTPLHGAVEGGHADVVRLLLSQKDCVIDSLDYNARTPFSYACRRGDLELVRLLWGRVHFDDKSHSVQYACRKGHLNIVMYYFEQGQAELVKEKALEAAVQAGYPEIVKFLLSAGNFQISSCSVVRDVMLRKVEEWKDIVLAILEYMNNMNTRISSRDESLVACEAIAMKQGAMEILDALERLHGGEIMNPPPTDDLNSNFIKLPPGLDSLNLQYPAEPGVPDLHSRYPRTKKPKLTFGPFDFPAESI